MVSLTDAELMAGLAAGDTSMLGELYARHYKMVKAALHSWAPEMTGPDMEDVTQEVFISLGKTAATYRDQSKFKAWLYRIASRKVLGWQRKTWIRRRFLERNRQPVAVAVVEEKSSPAQKTRLRKVVSQMLSKLPDKQRQVLWLHFVEGFEGEEIAAILHVRRATVYTRMHRARTTLLKSVHAATWKDVLSEEEP